jgi:hypothetical protein
MLELKLEALTTVNEAIDEVMLLSFLQESKNADSTIIKATHLIDFI